MTVCHARWSFPNSSQSMAARHHCLLCNNPPVHGDHYPKAGSKLGHRRRRWPSFEPALDLRVMLCNNCCGRDRLAWHVTGCCVTVPAGDCQKTKASYSNRSAWPYRKQRGKLKISSSQQYGSLSEAGRVLPGCGPA